MKYLISIILLLNFSCLIAQNETEITTKELNEHVSYLASDELKGRKPGTPEDLLSAEYIISQLKDAGLKLMGEDGFQTFEIVTDVELGELNTLSINGVRLQVNEDYIPYSYSANGAFKSKLVFAGYGFDLEDDTISWNDFENIDIQDKWVLVLTGNPDPDNENSAFQDFTKVRDKVFEAAYNGAAGVVFVSGSEWDPKDRLPSLYYDKAGGNESIPVIHITRKVGNTLFGKRGITIDSIEKKIKAVGHPVDIDLNADIEAVVDIQQKSVNTFNVIGMIEGNDPERKDEYIIVGAHYAHLGMGGPGSGSRCPDTLVVHNGADDNASGVAGVIELAGKMNTMDPARSIVFMAFGAEEMGLIGSHYYAKHPLLPNENLMAMVNFDMIGRLDTVERSIMVGGTGTSEESETLLKEIEAETDLNIAYSPGGFGASDHSSFYAQDIPVFYINSGVHQDYHTYKDDVEMINFEGQKEILDYSVYLIDKLANMDSALTFKESGPKNRTSGRMSLKVTLGIMPDFTSTENVGLGVGGVTPGRPADLAGMLKGDVIVAINGMPVKNIYEYMNRLKKLEPGQIITVDVMRDDKKIVLLVQL